MNKKDLKLPRVEFDDRGFAKENGYVLIAHFDEYGFFLGIEDSYISGGVSIGCRQTRVLPKKAAKEGFCWKWNGFSWFEEDITKRPVMIDSRHIPSGFEDFSIKMWEERQKKWIGASFKYSTFSHGGAEFLSIQNLMQVEKLLLEQELKLKNLFADSIEDMSLFTEYQALGGIWIMALYEITRHLLNDLSIPEKNNFTSLFEILSIIRMPLAKHEARKIKKATYASLIYSPSISQIAWQVADYKSKKLPPDSPEGSCEILTIYRREVADQFLELMNR